MPSLLVPLSGQLETRSISTGVESSQDTTHRFHFERVSDTKDPHP
jgi:hypothetical protein